MWVLPSEHVGWNSVSRLLSQFEYETGSPHQFLEMLTEARRLLNMPSDVSTFCWLKQYMDDLVDEQDVRDFIVHFLHQIAQWALQLGSFLLPTGDSIEYSRAFVMAVLSSYILRLIDIPSGDCSSNSDSMILSLLFSKELMENCNQTILVKQIVFYSNDYAYDPECQMCGLQCLEDCHVDEQIPWIHFGAVAGSCAEESLAFNFCALISAGHQRSAWVESAHLLLIWCRDFGAIRATFRSAVQKRPPEKLSVLISSDEAGSESRRGSFNSRRSSGSFQMPDDFLHSAVDVASQSESDCSLAATNVNKLMQSALMQGVTLKARATRSLMLNQTDDQKTHYTIVKFVDDILQETVDKDNLDPQYRIMRAIGSNCSASESLTDDAKEAVYSGTNLLLTAQAAVNRIFTSPTEKETDTVQCSKLQKPFCHRSRAATLEAFCSSLSHQALANSLRTLRYAARGRAHFRKHKSHSLPPKLNQLRRKKNNSEGQSISLMERGKMVHGRRGRITLIRDYSHLVGKNISKVKRRSLQPDHRFFTSERERVVAFEKNIADVREDNGERIVDENDVVEKLSGVYESSIQNTASGLVDMIFSSALQDMSDSPEKDALPKKTSPVSKYFDLEFLPDWNAPVDARRHSADDVALRRRSSCLQNASFGNFADQLMLTQFEELKLSIPFDHSQSSHSWSSSGSQQESCSSRGSEAVDEPPLPIVCANGGSYDAALPAAESSPPDSASQVVDGFVHSLLMASFNSAFVQLLETFADERRRKTKLSCEKLSKYVDGLVEEIFTEATTTCSALSDFSLNEEEQEPEGGEGLPLYEDAELLEELQVSLNFSMLSRDALQEKVLELWMMATLESAHKIHLHWHRHPSLSQLPVLVSVIRSVKCSNHKLRDLMNSWRLRDQRLGVQESLFQYITNSLTSV